MKRLHNFFEMVKAEWQTVVTPAEKRAILEDAKVIIGDILTGPYAMLATALINDLEKTIGA